VSEVGAAIAALRRGALAILPTDTVYGLAADAEHEDAAQALYAAKGRDTIRPTAILFASLEALVERVPELDGRALDAARALLPGPLTLVVPNPGHRYPWLNADRPDALGVRVPALAGPGRAILEACGALVATSANLPGGPDPRQLDEVPRELLAAAAATVDGGCLPGTPSTVVDLTGTEAAILREGAVPADEVLARLTGLTDR